MTASRRETQLIQAARLIKNGCCYIVGTGLPLLGAALGKRCFAPEAELLLESGFIGVEPREVPSSVTDLRLMCTASVLWDSYRYMGFMTNHRHYGRHDLFAFIGGAQIDPFGNVNSTLIGDYDSPKVRFAGSGGANGIASCCDTIIIMQHSRRRFVERVDYLTSPGWLDGPGGREAAGLPGDKGPRKVVSDLGVMAFDEDSRRMYLEGWYDYTTPEEIQENTGFPLDMSRARPIPPPEEEILRILRQEIDPQGIFIGKDKD